MCVVASVWLYCGMCMPVVVCVCVCLSVVASVWWCVSVVVWWLCVWLSCCDFGALCQTKKIIKNASTKWSETLRSLLAMLHSLLRGVDSGFATRPLYERKKSRKAGHPDYDDYMAKHTAWEQEWKAFSANLENAEVRRAISVLCCAVLLSHLALCRAVHLHTRNIPSPAL